MTVLTASPPQWRKHQTPPDGYVTALAFDGVITYRQLDYWTRAGHLEASEHSGSGYSRLWPVGEIRIARAIRRLLDLGFSFKTAANLARTAVPGDVIQLGTGVRVECSADLWVDA